TRVANASEAIGLVAVELGTRRLAADDADRGDPREFTPATPTVPSPQPRELRNRPPDSDGLDVGDRPDDLEVHGASSPDRSQRTSNAWALSGRHSGARIAARDSGRSALRVLRQPRAETRHGSAHHGGPIHRRSKTAGPA